MASFEFNANGSTAAQGFKGYRAAGAMPEVGVIVQGTFGGGTLTVEYSLDGVVWVPDGTLEFTEAGTGFFKLPYACSYRATLSGSTTPDLTVHFL